MNDFISVKLVLIGKHDQFLNRYLHKGNNQIVHHFTLIRTDAFTGQINQCNAGYLQERVGAADLLNPYDNIKGGLYILRGLFEKYLIVKTCCFLPNPVNPLFRLLV